MRRRFGLIVTVCGLGGTMMLTGMLAGCAVQPPTGPTVMALPAPGKSLENFQRDDYDCRNYAAQQTAYASAGQAGATPGVTGAALGTLGGAALGAALGAVGGNAGAGAAIGGATGLVGGAAVGSNSGAASQYSLQQRYNVTYTQCMYTRGDSVRSPPPGYAYGVAPAYGYPPPVAYPYVASAWPGFWGPNVVVTGGGGWYGHRWHR